jgi:hypothetical protein
MIGASLLLANDVQTTSLQKAILIVAYLGAKCTHCRALSAALVNDKGKLEVTQNQRVLTPRPVPSGHPVKVAAP